MTGETLNIVDIKEEIEESDGKPLPPGESGDRLLKHCLFNIYRSGMQQHPAEGTAGRKVIWLPAKKKRGSRKGYLSQGEDYRLE